MDSNQIEQRPEPAAAAVSSYDPPPPPAPFWSFSDGESYHSAHENALGAFNTLVAQVFREVEDAAEGKLSMERIRYLIKSVEEAWQTAIIDQ